MSVEQAKKARDAAWAELKRLQTLYPIARRQPEHFSVINHAFDEAQFCQMQYESALRWARYEQEEQAYASHYFDRLRQPA